MAKVPLLNAGSSSIKITEPGNPYTFRILPDEVMQGVVSLPHGWGHDRDGTRLTVARQFSGVSVNDVTSEFEVDTLSGTAAFNGLAVSIRR